MTKFRVTISALQPVTEIKNPFHPARMDVHKPIPANLVVRQWEFEAEDENEVRKLWDDAQKAHFPYVMGFALDHIEQLPATTS